MSVFINISTAEWQAALLLVPKKNSKEKFRMTVDTCPVNAATTVEAWPIPHMKRRPMNSMVAIASPVWILCPATGSCHWTSSHG